MMPEHKKMQKSLCPDLGKRELPSSHTEFYFLLIIVIRNGDYYKCNIIRHDIHNVQSTYVVNEISNGDHLDVCLKLIDSVQAR
jgi:hypothetical protein